MENYSPNYKFIDVELAQPKNKERIIPDQDGRLWKYFFNYKKQCQRIIAIFSAWLGLELILSQILPSIIPETIYFRMFLPWVAIKKTQHFLTNKFDIELDERLGWRNRKNINMHRVLFDEYGSRSYHGISPGQRKKWRVIFMGDSRIGGYKYVSNKQTINAFLENDEIETLNFGTNLYGLDQVYLSLPEVIRSFQPDIVVICIGSDVGEGLDCQYLPFLHVYIGEPLLKPRFTLENGRLTLHTPPYRKFLEQVPHSSQMLEYLRQNDTHYRCFQKYQKWESTPLLCLFSLIKKRFEQRLKSTEKLLNTIQEKSINNIELANAIIDSTRQLAKSNKVELIYLLLPRKAELTYNNGACYNKLISLVKAKSMTYIDVLSLFRQQKQPAQFYADVVHTTFHGNYIIAQGIREVIEDMSTRH